MDRIRMLQKELFEALSTQDAAVFRKIQRHMSVHLQKAAENLDWLYANMHPYFFITMKEEIEAIVNLAGSLHLVPKQRKVSLSDEEKKLIVARLDVPGSLYDTLRTLQEREISYAEMTHSYEPIPGAESELEIQRFEFDRRSTEEILKTGEVRIPRGARKAVLDAMRQLYPDFEFQELDRVLKLLWLNNESYVRISPPERIARVLWIYQQGRRRDGLSLDVEETPQVTRHRESRLLFSVGNPQQRGFLTQVSEVFQRLNIGVRRSYSLIINTGIHPYFLGTFYVTPRDNAPISKDSELFRALQIELYNTQILSTTRSTYTHYVADRIMTGEEASLTNAFIAFCHTALAHNQPDRFNLEAVKSAFQSDPDVALRMIRLFKTRFDPDVTKRQAAFEKALREANEEIENYNTGHRYLDEIRRTVFQTCLLFIRHCLKTNFFVPEKHALAFRLAPAYLAEMGPEFTSDLPPDAPFRVTFFFGRHGAGYHIGFSDIARGGWRTIICRTQDEYHTNMNTLFRENFVLAHTQHLKNKDIYEGGSKLVVVLDAADAPAGEAVTQRLYKLQYGFINAFLDIFVTENGRAKDPRVVDYYGEDEPIELGPDENMHDAMIELIARQSVKRGYQLGIGIMSSKEVGINHKEYGVTSRGVVKFAEIAMRELGVDIHQDRFTVKITGGTNGDVAGNAMALLLERCPKAEIRSIVDGSGAVYDPQGVNREELARLLLKQDVVAFKPEAAPRGRVHCSRGATASRRPAGTVPEGDPHRNRGGGNLGHARRIPPRVRRPDLLGAGRPLPALRRPAGDHRPGQLAAPLRQERPAHRAGDRRGGQLLHHPRGPGGAAETRHHRDPRRLGQQVRRDLLVLRDHRQPADEREGVPAAQAALRGGRAGDPGQAGRRRDQPDLPALPRERGQPALHRDQRRPEPGDQRALRAAVRLFPGAPRAGGSAPVPPGHPGSPAGLRAEHAQVQGAGEEAAAQAQVGHPGERDRLLHRVSRGLGSGLRNPAAGIPETVLRLRPPSRPAGPRQGLRQDWGRSSASRIPRKIRPPPRRCWPSRGSPP